MNKFPVSGFLSFAVFALIVFGPHAVCGQTNFSRYQPRDSHTGASSDLIQSMQRNLLSEVETPDNPDVLRLTRKINAARVRGIVNTVKRGVFIKDDSLETFVNAILQRIAAAQGEGAVGRVLVYDSPHQNAYCYGKGTYIITVGLLGRSSNEDEIAFFLAHEYAHDILHHIPKRVERVAQRIVDGKHKNHAGNFLSPTTEEEELARLHEYRELVYTISRNSRSEERDADSLALRLMKSAGYDPHAAITALTILQNPLSPERSIGADLLWPFHCEEFPLQMRWFDERLAVYHKQDTDTLFFASDSIASHPDLDSRKQVLAATLPDDRRSSDPPDPFVSAVSLMAEFETLQSCYESRMYDFALFYGLQLLHQYPDNTFVITRIGTILIKLYELKSTDEHAVWSYVPRYTINYSEELTLLNNMLHNLRTKEMGELTYYFLKSPGRFNPEEQSHYYLLWKISELTYRNEMAGQIDDAFKDKFDYNIRRFETE